MRLGLALIVLLLGACASRPDATRPDQPPAFKTECPATDFNFALGHWRVEQRFATADGEWRKARATAHIRRSLDGCAQLETLRAGPNGASALMLRRVLPGGWVLDWTDAVQADFTRYSGSFVDQLGVFEAPARGDMQARRIVYARPRADSFHWELAVSDDGQSWRSLMVMFYQREP